MANGGVTMFRGGEGVLKTVGGDDELRGGRRPCCDDISYCPPHMWYSRKTGLTCSGDVIFEAVVTLDDHYALFFSMTTHSA